MKKHSRFSLKKTLCTLLAVLIATLPAAALDNRLPQDQVEKLLEETTSHYQGIETLETSFTQVRTTRLLKKPAITKGKLFYRKPGFFLWKFTSPYTLSILSKGKYLYKIDRKRGTYSRLRVKKYQSIIMNFMDVSKAFKFLNKYFYVKQIDTKLKDLYIIFIPKKRRVKKRVKLVEIWLNPDTKLFHRIKVEEKNGSITDITFQDCKLNRKLPENIFEVHLKGLKKEKWQE
ncbi:MAG: outer membrane lipoprotein carrier protein LolA [Acidobacteria bacterium]|nr:outer membrane lipoprotein carrier protein LolA [Acidobacteriota bacterium]